MRPNPLLDIITFVSTTGIATGVFLLLFIASLIIALRSWRLGASQLTIRNLGVFLLRLAVGIMWWQQSLWKIPPNYDGLRYWMQQMVDHASIPLQSQMVAELVLPNIAVFGPLVYAIEVIIGVSLMLGWLTRAGALLGALMAINLWLGLYSAPGEWPWTYGFLIIIQLLFVLDPPGRSLGADTLLHRRGRLPAFLG